MFTIFSPFQTLKNLALVEITITINRKWPNTNLRFVQLTKPTNLNVQFYIIKLSSIIQCIHFIIIPIIYFIIELNTENKWLAYHYIDIYIWTCQFLSFS